MSERGALAGWSLVAGATLLTAAGWLHANAAARTGADLLGAGGTGVDWLATLGAHLHHEGAAVLLRVRLPLLVSTLVVLAMFRWRARGAWPLAARLGAIALAALAQSFLSHQGIVPGLLLYVAAGGLWLSAGASPPQPEGAGLRHDLLALGMLALFVVIASYRMDVFPNLDDDEIAYTTAARMKAGQLAPGDILPGMWRKMYSLARFEAQAVPLALQTAAVRFGAPGLVPTRFASLAAVVASLLIAYLISRKRLGGTAGVWMLAFATSSYMLHGQARIAFYIAVSILHGLVAALLMLRMVERPGTTVALALAVALGSCIYFYQLSWFTPVFCAAFAAVSPEVWRERRFAKHAAQVVVVAVLVAGSGLWIFRDGFSMVGAQTFHKAVWLGHGAEPPGSEVATLLGPESLDAEGMAQVTADFDTIEGAEGEDLAATVADRPWIAASGYGPTGRAALMLVGTSPSFDRSIEQLVADGWIVVSQRRSGGSLLQNLRDTAMQLFAGAMGWETNGRLIEVGLVNPVLMPLLVLGMLCAARRWRDPWMRLLLVWVLLAAFLPAAATGMQVRRTVLVLPLAQVLMTLPLVESLARVRGPTRGILLGGAAVGALAALAVGTHALFGHWNLQFGEADHATRGTRLELMKAIQSVPAGEPVLVASPFPHVEALLARAAGLGAERVHVHPQVIAAPLQALALSCPHDPPFVWIASADRTARELVAVLGRDHGTETRTVGRTRVIRIGTRRAGACNAAEPARRPQPRADRAGPRAARP